MQANDIGLIGLAVMGQNLALNMERNSFKVAVYNRTEAMTHTFLEGPALGKNITATYSLKEFAASLKRPRKVILMVKAGPAVDDILSQLRPYLQPGDLLIDGGNSFFQDTERRSKALESEGFQYLGMGISGGEEGALWGPSMMPGGSNNAYAKIESLLRVMAAKVDGEPCVTYIGPRGSGHYVKMIHNAIEYADMQLIAEAYDILHRLLGLSHPKLHQIFAQWNDGPLSSYLIEITADILSYLDQGTGRPLVELILDEAEQKGTGLWASQNALDLGVAIPTIQAAVEMRFLSASKSERELAARLFPPSGNSYPGNREDFIDSVGDALYASKICSYAQGMALLRRAAHQYDYDLNYAEIARIWRGGCIIRARFLDDIRKAYTQEPNLPNLLVASFFREALLKSQKTWRHVVEAAVQQAIPVPAMSASLAYFDTYRSARLPANVIQAQRDYFGAHTYRRVDREGIFHTEWKSKERSQKD